jgi:hypothetical protein
MYGIVIIVVIIVSVVIVVTAHTHTCCRIKHAHTIAGQLINNNNININHIYNKRIKQANIELTLLA